MLGNCECALRPHDGGGAPPACRPGSHISVRSGSQSSGRHVQPEFPFIPQRNRLSVERTLKSISPKTALMLAASKPLLARSISTPKLR